MLIALLAVSLAFVPGKIAYGETTETANASVAERERLYDDLASEADALARYFGQLKRVVRVVRPTVVHIETAKDQQTVSSAAGVIEEAGSGVIWRLKDEYYVLTNRHVIRDYGVLKNIRIRLANGRQVQPTRVWADRATDVAVLAISAPDLHAARLGNSNRLEVGDFVLAVGSPFGLSHSVTFGIVSAEGRRDLKLGDDGVRYQDFLQTDVAINPGNSGGPLINLRGEVVGINTAIASNTGSNDGVGFAIPINMVIGVAQQLVENGQVVRAFLGVHLDSKFDAEAAARLGLPRPEGARVTGITPNSPAADTDLKTGDVILEFDGVRIEDDSHLVNRVGLTPVGKEVKIVVFREGQIVNVNVTVTDRSQYR